MLPLVAVNQLAGVPAGFFVARRAVASFAFIGILLEKAAPLTGRVVICFVGAYQPAAERFGSSSWNGVEKPVR